MFLIHHHFYVTYDVEVLRSDDIASLGCREYALVFRDQPEVELSQLPVEIVRFHVILSAELQPKDHLSIRFGIGLSLNLGFFIVYLLLDPETRVYGFLN